MQVRIRPQYAGIRLKCLAHDPWPVSVAGNLPELGGWDPDSALPMRLKVDKEGRHEWWATIVCLRGQPFEFKFVAKADGAPLWEAGANRVCLPNDQSLEVAGEFRKCSRVRCGT